MQLQLEVFEKHPAWPSVLYVWKTLVAKGHIAQLAGGCVRDGLIGRTPKDFDIASDAMPSEVESYFDKTIDVGKDFGVMIVHHLGHNVEVSRFRTDGEYKDGRRPESVEFCDAEEDAKRRDFTVNSLFYDPATEKVVDYVNGTPDLEAKLIRAVGEPRKRFEEDRLRIIRAIRLAAELDFEIEDKTWLGVIEHSPNIKEVSTERITDEVRKTISSANPLKGLFLMHHSGLLEQLWPDLNFFQSELYENYLYRGLRGLGEHPRLDIFLSFLIMLQVEFENDHVGMNWRVGVDRQLAHLQQAFGFPRETIRSATFCLRELPEALELNTGSLVLLSEEFGLTLLDLMRMHYEVREKDTKAFEAFLSRYMNLTGEDGHLPKSFINGNDLAEVGIPAGPVYAELLRRAYHSQLENKIKSKDEALAFIRGLWNSETQSLV